MNKNAAEQVQNLFKNYVNFAPLGKSKYSDKPNI